MISSAALWFVPLLYYYLIATVTATCNFTVSCPCGSGKYTYKLCIDDISDKRNACDVWSQCKTCQDNLLQCVTCPENRIGPTCSEVIQTRRKRQYPTNRRQSINPRFFGSCPRLESPDLGSVSCRQLGNFRSCTGRCLPGYSFHDRSGVAMNEDEITLECRRNTWEPLRSFPPCRSGGHCMIKIEGGGSYNCTTGMDGTRCDIFCSGIYMGRFHCFPGRNWNPDLPYCAITTGSNGGAREPSCSCQNSGYCDSNGNCVCPSGWTGENCGRADLVEPTTCPDPGFPRGGGDRLYEDGSSASTIGSFLVGESVVFSCRGSSSALQGSSITRCRSDGSWTAQAPRCVRIPIPSITCPDPGIISNGDRLNTDGTPSETDQTYTQGQSVVYSCLEGYALHGTSMLTCQRSGQWSSDRPRCSRITPVTGDSPAEGNDDNERTCDQPEADINGFIVSHPLLDTRRGNNVFPVGTELVFNCNEGYQSVGPVILSCLGTGEWSSLPPTCEKSFPTESPPAEIRVSCKHPGLDPNGDIADTPLLDPRVRGQRFPPGTELTYTCKEGYELEGIDVIECTRTGEWSDPAPSCVQENRSPDPGSVKQCKNLGPVSNGRVVIYRTLDESKRPDDNDDEYPTGTRLLFSCEVGYTLMGPARLVCRSNGKWNAEPPFCVEDCGRSLFQTTHKITHGTKTVPGEWPWTVAIAATNKNNVTGVICGGALLDTRTVLTAAHCLTDYSVFTLYFGKFHRKDVNDDRKVDIRRSTRIVSHRYFNGSTYENDIALLRFEPNVRYSERIQTICLPTPQSTRRNLIPGKKGYVTGWGINEKKQLSEELLMAHLPVQPIDKCMEAFEDLALPRTIRPGMFCAGFDAGVVSTCRGDSGSPFVFYDNRTERHTIEGLVSWGSTGECGLPRRYTVYTKVADYMNWILRNWPR